MKSVTDTFKLANGVEMPCVGYGTWETPDDVVAELVKCALETGYRHIDTANAYGNEVGVGKGIKASGVKREDIFLTTKHWVTERGYEKTLATIEQSLKNLDTDYIDLYLIHWPCVEKVTPDWAEVNADTWRGFEKAYEEGKIRALGVSNFQEKHLEALKKYAKIPVVVNQIEFHPGYTQMETVKYCQDNGILVQAWSPLGHGTVLGSDAMKAMAEKYGVSTAKICIRYALQHGVVPLPKSTNPARMADNMDVFGFEISAEDMAAIDNLPEMGFTGWLPEDAPAESYYG